MVHTLKNNHHKSFETGITASTTQTQSNGALTGSINEISTVANASDTVTLPTVSEGLEVTIVNNGANTLQIFPASADNLGNGLNSSITLAAGLERNFFGIDDINWVNFGSPGSSSSTVTAYGGLYEDNSSGSAISATTSYVGWVSATAGVVDGSIVSFTDNATADRLTIGTGGAGDYRVAFHANVTNSGGKLTTGAIHVNGVEQVAVKMSLTGDSSKAVLLAASNPLTLAVGDYVDLRFKSESSDTVTVYQPSLNIELIS